METKETYTIEEVMTLLHIQGAIVPPQRVVIATLGIIRALKNSVTCKLNKDEEEKK